MAAPPKFLDYVLRYYAVEGVSKACLALQETYNLDVDLVLFAIWLGAVRQIVLSDENLTSADALVTTWRDQIIRPLRVIRRRLKATGYPFTHTDIEKLYRDVLGAEIFGEKIEIAVLEAHSANWPDHANIDFRDAISANLAKVIGYFGGTPEDAGPQIETLVNATQSI
ncbi:MAG: TIGR02444 family protein [Acidocella sp. 20-57-95]|nr:MAG: TIGR02444 family protein [Acidocella sp. 20-57-95]OYV60381.1 MAG: TIGR02444 family protein [Acidocella sp. 21-58-7]HQT64812.1 TIGR02444 family protein [Acidocella sp.]